MTGIFIGLTGTAETLLDYLDARRDSVISQRTLWRRFVSRCIFPGLAYVVPAVGTIIFLLRPVAAVPTGVGEATMPFFLRVARLLNGPIALAYDEIEWFIVFPFVGGLVLTLRHMTSNLPKRAFLRDPLFVTAIGLLLLYLFLPDKTVVRWIPFRLVPYLYLVFFLWLGSAALTLRGRAQGVLYSIVLIAAVLSGLATAVVRPLSMARVNDFLDEYVSAFEHIEPGSTVLPIPMSNMFNGEPISGYASIDVFYQSQHYLIWEKPAGILLNGQASVNYFPIVFRSEVNPFTRIDRLLPEFRAYRHFDLQSYREKTGVRVDYVILWGEDQNIPPPKEWPESVFFSQLARDYEQIYRSPQRGLQRLYRRKIN